MMRRIAFSGLLLLGMWTFIRGVQYPIIHYKTSDGLPQNYITALAQDSDGFIWVGTQSGIGIFDGNDFIRTLSTMEGLPGSYINDLVAGPNNQMWVATDEGAALMQSMKTTHVWARGTRIQRLFPVSGTGLGFFALGGGRLLRVDDSQEPATVGFLGNDKQQRIRHAALDTRGTLTVLANRQVYQLTSEGQWIPFDTNRAIDFLIYRQDKLYLAGEGVLSIAAPGESIVSVNLPAACGEMRDLDIDQGGGIWLGTDKGLFSYDPGPGDWQHFHAGNGLNYSRVNRVFVDREHTVFAGTRYGLSFLSGITFRMYSTDDGLPSEFICSLLEDTPGTILAGGYDGISEIRNGRGRAFAVNRQLQNKQVRALLKVGPRNYLVGTRYNGIFRWDRNQRLELLLGDVRVLSAIRDSNSVFWFGTDNGLLRYDGHNSFQTILEGLHHQRVWAMAEWSPGVLILGTGNGLQVYSHGRFVSSDLETRLGPINITDIHVASSGEILVSSVVHGLFIYRETDLLNFTTRNGLLHNDVWYALKDSQGQIWLNTSVSLDRYHNGYFSHFNKNTGLFGDEGFIHTTLETSDGSLWFSVSPGLVELPPSTRSLDPVPPRVPNLSIRVDDQPIPLDKPIQLSSRQNSVEFSFFTVSTRRDQPLYYRWRLLPRQQEWQPPSQKTSVHFLNLREGLYTFEVMADNGFFQEDSQKQCQRISFEVTPPLWRQWWFWGLTALAFFGLIRLATFIRLRMLETQKRKLEQRVYEHTSELARKNHELVVLSITDPLTGLKNRRYLNDRIGDDVHMIERSLFPRKDSAAAGRRYRREDLILTFYVIDIDHFKSVNDIHGHTAGDRVLVGVAQALRRELRTSDIIIRWGGEEFLVVTRNKRADNSYLLAERLRKSIESRAFHISSGETVRRTVSIGFARYPFVQGNIRAVSWQQVISLADSAMYLAKLNGRNLSVGIDPGPGFTEVPFSQIITRMDEQAAAGRIRLYSTRDELQFHSHT
ncbi:MAG TPA: GGDEF domain-containing protein [Candidatus Aminicenantes bacterium]|nr:GGDEF domain-containing protein [Candidatus Aminicenantes bacterium]